MNTHTPGPWLYNPYSGVVVAKNGDYVARPCEYGSESETPHAQATNGRLISAAPDLYDAADMALNTLLACCIPSGGVDDRKTMLEAVAMLRAAITKATG